MKIKLLLFVVSLLSATSSFGQINEGFEDTSTPPAGWTYNSVTHGTNNPRNGARSAVLNGSGDAMTTPLVSNPYQLSFWYRRSSNNTAWSISIEVLDNTNAVIATLPPITSATQTYTRYTADLSAYTNIKIRITDTRASGTQERYIDDFSISLPPTNPTLTLTPTPLTGFTYIVGNGPSAEQSFTATGINLTGNVLLTAPSNYEISTTSGSGFGASVTLTQTGGNASGTIYVRLKAGLAVNSYNQNITATSTGATNRSVALNGTVTGSLNSDIIAVPSSEATTIASTINDAAPLTASTGIQVWQFKVRDGGATLNDSDTLPTILTGFTLAQANGNAVDTWTDAIRTIALFDGTTFIATGTVTENIITSFVFKMSAWRRCF
jgi:hypothetical protein